MSAWWIMILWTILNFQNSQATANISFAIQGTAKVIQWRMAEGTDRVVNIIDPSGEALFSVLGTSTVPGSGSNSDRVNNTGNTDTNTGHIEFTLNDVNVKDAGDYKARIDENTQTVGVTLVVYAKPSKPVLTADAPPINGKDMLLQCNASSNSQPDGYLTMNYTWFINGTDLPSNNRYIATGSKLEVHSVLKSDSTSMFTCKGYENSSLLSNASDGYRPDVMYKPENLVLQPNTVSYTLLESSSLEPITCFANCNPNCTYKWKRDGVDILQGPVLNLTKINRSQAGDYTCEVNNTVGYIRSDNISIVVEYPPENTNLTTNTVGTGIKEHYNLSVTCTTDSVPPPDIVIYSEGDGQRMFYQKPRTVKVQRTKPAQCQDNGDLFCVATNKHGNSTSQKINIKVLCLPRPKIGFQTNNIVSIGKSENVDIIGAVVAYPRPGITWMFRKDGSSAIMAIDNNTDRVQIFMSSKHVTYSSRLVKTNAAGLTDFGYYVMNASNQNGSVLLTYNVIPKQQSLEMSDNSVILIGGVAGGISVLLIIVIILVVVLLKRRKTKQDEDTDHINIGGLPLKHEPDDGMKQNILYESAGPFDEHKNSAAECQYAAVDKSAKKKNNSVDVYAVVDKKGKKPEKALGKSKKKVETYDNLGGDFDDGNAKVKQASSGNKAGDGKTSSRKKNKDGLVYVDVVTGNAGKGKKNGIHGTDKKVEYVDVDFTKHADPLPSDDEDD